MSVPSGLNRPGCRIAVPRKVAAKIGSRYALRHVRVEAAGGRGGDHPSDAGDQARDREGPDADPCHAHTGESADLTVRADEAHVAAERREVQNVGEPEHEREPVEER